MRKFFVFIVSLIVGVTSVTSLSAATKSVGVYIVGGQPQEERNIVESAVVSRVSRCSDYKVFERNSAFVKALEKEEGYQLSGEVDEREIRSVGMRLGVDYVIVVWVNVGYDNTCDMSARLIELESGEIVKAVSLQRECSDKNELRNMANSVTYRLLDRKSK